MKSETLLHYVSVEWLHGTSSEPTHLYYELDANRYECRKVEVYQDGTMDSASALHGQGSTFLAWEPHPAIADIQEDPQFRVSELTSREFEQIWRQATSPVLETVVI